MGILFACEIGFVVFLLACVLGSVGLWVLVLVCLYLLLSYRFDWIAGFSWLLLGFVFCFEFCL